MEVKKILFHSDNQSVVEILNSCKSKSERVMTLVRHIVFWSLYGNFHIKAQFISGFINVFADFYIINYVSYSTWPNIIQIMILSKFLKR
jgi:hypothetical protein